MVTRRRPLPISVRFFLVAFVPISVALIAGVGWFRSQVGADVRDGLRRGIAEAQQAQAAVRLDARRQRLNLLATLAENASLKAVLSLWRESSSSAAARQTVEDQLHDMAKTLEADLLAFRDAEGRAVSAVARAGSGWQTVNPRELPAGGQRLAKVQGRFAELLSVPVNSDSENLGMLVVGKRFEPGSFHPQAVLVDTSLQTAAASAGLDQTDAGDAARVLSGSACQGGSGCALMIRGADYLAIPVDARLLDEGYALWTLHSVDRATAGLLATANQSLWLVLAATLIAALLAGAFGARAVARPLLGLIENLRASERSGVLQGDFPVDSSASEVNELARAFNLAARSVADAQRRLDETYLQITQTMAQTLDARDPYTAGHSSRVSDYAVAIAQAMNLPPAETDIIRVGANLHDIGKIGIPDAVLQKPGPLTEDEFEQIRKHTVIGKRILEGVVRFHDYLSIVELHHENQDGTGYPWGLRGEKVPLGARIVHVVDAYDAMTTNRPYRRAMPAAKAQEILRRHAGSQFDPKVVEVFLRLVQADADASLPELGPQLAALEQELQTGPEAAEYDGEPTIPH